MKDDGSVWFRIGAALERARLALPGGEEGEEERPRRRSRRGSRGERRGPSDDRKGRASRDGGGGRRASREEDDGEHSPGARLVEALLHRDEGRPSPVAGLAAAGSGALALQVARRWADSRRPPVAALVAAAGAGAGAGLLRELVAAAAARDADDLEEGLVEAVLAGAGEGMVYAALLEPWLPESPWVQGVMVGGAGYVAAPWGGVRGLLAPLAPQRKLPVVGRLLEGGEEERERSLVEHLGFGVALALLYHLMARR